MVSSIKMQEEFGPARILAVEGPPSNGPPAAQDLKSTGDTLFVVDALGRSCPPRSYGR